MNKRELMDWMEPYDDDVDINVIMRDIEEAHDYMIEMLEERQEKSGMYYQQDMIDLRRIER